MSYSPVPGAGTLLRVEEVRQRLNQCGLQGEKVTRKTARKYVPPTATSSRTVADMARRLGSVGPEGREPLAKGGKQGEENLVTGEIYRSFSIHTRNIHKKFQRQASTNGSEDDISSLITTTTTTLSATAGSTSDNSRQSSPTLIRERISRAPSRPRELSPISLKIASAPTPHRHHPNGVIHPIPVSHAAPNKSLPLNSIKDSSIPHTQPSPTQKAKSPTVPKKPMLNGENNHFKDLLNTPQTPTDKPSETKTKDTIPKKQNEENKGFGLKNMNLFSKFKISPFSNKKSPTENKIVAVSNSGTLTAKEPDQKQTQKDNTGPKICVSKANSYQDSLQPKSLPNGNICDTKTLGHPKTHDKKITHAKHALSGERVNIQELMNNPKVPRQEPTSPKTKPKSPKHGTLRKAKSLAENTVGNSSSNQQSLKTTTVNSSNNQQSLKTTTANSSNNQQSLKSTTTNNTNNHQSLKNSGANGIRSHPHIPHLNNIKTDTATNNDFVNGGGNKAIANTASPICDKLVNKVSPQEDSAIAGTSVNTEDCSKASSEVKEDTNKPNGTVEPMDCTGVVFYKAKCLLQDPGKMGSKEKVKVDESEPSFYEEAPFERRDVTVKSDRWVTDLYTVDSLLGKGKFGEVKKCQEQKTGRQLAAKFIEVNGPQDRNDVLNELEIMKNLQHPRLLQLYDAFEIRDRFCLVMELVNGGELFERVINDDFILTEKACVMFTRQICDGIAFMHTQNILHLDMKPENILCLTREGNRIKIIDFGLARKYNPKDDLRVLFGTPEFVAPEVVNFDPIAPATDMWSIGVVCYVLLSGLSPFMGESEQETLANVTLAHWDFSAEEFDNISSEAKDFISKLLVKDPRKRMKSAECLEHQWLRRSVKREGHLPERSLSKKRLRKFVYRRKWQKAINAMLALRRMGVTLS